MNTGGTEIKHHWWPRHEMHKMDVSFPPCGLSSRWNIQSRSPLVITHTVCTARKTQVTDRNRLDAVWSLRVFFSLAVHYVTLSSQSQGVGWNPESHLTWGKLRRWSPHIHRLRLTLQMAGQLLRSNFFLVFHVRGWELGYMVVIALILKVAILFF